MRAAHAAARTRSHCGDVPILSLTRLSEPVREKSTPNYKKIIQKLAIVQPSFNSGYAYFITPSRTTRSQLLGRAAAAPVLVAAFLASVVAGLPVCAFGIRPLRWLVELGWVPGAVSRPFWFGVVPPVADRLPHGQPIDLDDIPDGASLPCQRRQIQRNAPQRHAAGGRQLLTAGLEVGAEVAAVKESAVPCLFLHPRLFVVVDVLLLLRRRHIFYVTARTILWVPGHATPMNVRDKIMGQGTT